MLGSLAPVVRRAASIHPPSRPRPTLRSPPIAAGTRSLALVNLQVRFVVEAPGRRPLRVLGVGATGPICSAGCCRPRRDGIRGRVGPVSRAACEPRPRLDRRRSSGTLVLLLAASALAATGQTTAAAVYAVVVLVNTVVLFARRDDAARVLEDAGRR